VATSAEVVEALVACGADVTVAVACTSLSPEFSAHLLLHVPDDVDARWPPALADAQLCAALLAAGVAVDGEDCEGNSALHLACSGDVVRLLVGAGAHVDARNHANQTPLHTARNAEVCEALLACGGVALLEERDTEGNTALLTHLTALDCVDRGVAQLLLHAGRVNAV
jgi:hypothetical protein